MALPKVVKLYQHSTTGPAQWYGMLENGEKVYIIYKHGMLDIEIAKKITDEDDSTMDTSTMLMAVSDYLDVSFANGITNSN